MKLYDLHVAVARYLSYLLFSKLEHHFASKFYLFQRKIEYVFWINFWINLILELIYNVFYSFIYFFPLLYVRIMIMRLKAIASKHFILLNSFLMGML